MYCNVIATVFHVAIACVLVLKYDMNIHGVGIASSVQFIVRFLVSYILLKTDPKFNVNLQPFFHYETVQHLGHQIHLSLMSMSLGIWSWWAFDVFTLIASYMSIEALAAQSILRNISLLFFMVPVGLSISTGILVGNNIGAMHLEAAVYFARM